jgi:hypothetical protein
MKCCFTPPAIYFTCTYAVVQVEVVTVTPPAFSSTCTYAVVQVEVVTVTPPVFPSTCTYAVVQVKMAHYYSSNVFSSVYMHLYSIRLTAMRDYLLDLGQ